MRQRYLLVTVVILLGLGCVYGSTALAPARAADGDTLPGTATLTVVVNAPKPFKAAQVHLMNVEKNVLFMVYTSGGRYRAVNLFPGRYEITVRKPGFAADPKTVVVAANGAETVNFSLREQAAHPIRQGEFGFTTQRAGEVKLVSYDELYPKGPGRVVFEKTCLYCHGNNFFPIKQLPEPQWSHFIDYMLGKDNERGAMVPAGTLTEKDRAVLLAYLTQNFGPQGEKRG